METMKYKTTELENENHQQHPGLLVRTYCGMAQISALSYRAVACLASMLSLGCVGVLVWRCNWGQTQKTCLDIRVFVVLPSLFLNGIGGFMGFLGIPKEHTDSL